MDNFLLVIKIKFIITKSASMTNTLERLRHKIF